MILLVVALILVAVSLFVSNEIVRRVSAREKERVEQWGAAIHKKMEMVRLTNNTFNQLREREREKIKLWSEATKEVTKISPLNGSSCFEFPLKIIQDNEDIPVIMMDNFGEITGFIHVDFDTNRIRKQYHHFSEKQLEEKLEDSLKALTQLWQKKNPPFTVEIYDGMFTTFYFNDSKTIIRLEKERDSLIQAFNHDLINNENMVPLLLIEPKTKKIIGHNLGKDFDSINVEQYIYRFSKVNEPIHLQLDDHTSSILYYDESPELKQLRYFPYIQFLAIGLFIFIGYLIFSTFRKAEQDKVWAGMAKETAHQLGTPLSSLSAWIDFLEAKDISPEVIQEMKKDVERLVKVTDRFSKIGSETPLNNTNISATVQSVCNYMRPRISEQVKVDLRLDKDARAYHNVSLFEWVLENLCNNAIDAMSGKGDLTVLVSKDKHHVYIDVTDTGKGIPASQYRRIFEPGFSTKKRGWGLGLSLVKRIISSYHKGKIFVLHSEEGKGTTFRIVLKKAD